METLHLRAEPETIEAIMAVVNEFSQAGKSIEVLDNVSYQQEQNMILNGLTQAKNGDLKTHEQVWRELLTP